MTVVTGMRAIEPEEGSTGLYKQFLPEGVSLDTPIQLAFPAASDGVLAILAARMASFELVDELEDPEVGNKPPEKLHPTLGGREWILRRYNAVHAETGARVEITVVNGEPVQPTGNEMNRSTTVPAPRAPQTFVEYLSYLPADQVREARNYVASYAHLIRLAAQAVEAARKSGLAQLGRMSLVGNMPQPLTWDKPVADGSHNGPTMALKEILPVLRATGRLAGVKPDDLHLIGR